MSVAILCHLPLSSATLARQTDGSKVILHNIFKAPSIIFILLHLLTAPDLVRMPLCHQRIVDSSRLSQQSIMLIIRPQ